MGEMEKLGEVLIGPCLRSQWTFAGEVQAVTLSATDLTDERTWASMRVIEGYGGHEPARIGGFLVHDPGVAAVMSSAEGPSLRTLHALTALAEAAFVPIIDPAGLVVTSTAPENENMHGNRWVTDSVYNLVLMAPEQRPNVIRILAAHYTSPEEQAAFHRCIANPELYRSMASAQEGVAHIFQIQQIGPEWVTHRDGTWFNNKRLESHGLALRTFCEYLLGELGVAPDPDEDRVYRAIAALALYFQAIDYVSAPSAGAWEEVPLPGGLSWDTEAIRQGYVALKRLLFAHARMPTGSRATIHARILHEGKRLSAIAGKPGAAALFEDPAWVQRLIDDGEAVVRQRVFLQAEAPGYRGLDATLTFLSQSDVRVAKEPLDDARAYKALLDAVEGGLVRPSGMIRYAPFTLQPGQDPQLFDSYLTANYWLGFDEDGYFNPARTRLVQQFGSMDASNPTVLARRTELGIPDREAEWFMVSEMARGYARLARTAPAGPLQRECVDKAWEYLLRSFGRITPAGVTKSNGNPSPPAAALPEAYEWVRIRSAAVGKAGGGHSERVLPGANTTLAWAASSLRRAIEEVGALLSP